MFAERNKRLDIYSLYKPAYLLSKVLLLAPFSLHRSECESKKKYCLLQVLLIGCMTYICYQSLNDVVFQKNFGSSTIVMYFNKVLSVLQMIVVIIIFVTSHLYAQEAPDILAMVNTLDNIVNKHNMAASTDCNTFNTRIVLLYACMANLLIGKVLLDMYLDGIISFDNIFKFASRMLSGAIIVQYATILNTVYWKMKIVNDYIEQYSINKVLLVKQECFFLLQQIYEICLKVEKIFGLSLASVFFVIFIEYLQMMFAWLATYWIRGVKITEILKLSKFALWTTIINSFWTTFVHCNMPFFFADRIHKEANRSGEVTGKLYHQALGSRPLRKFVHQLQFQIAQNKITLTAAKFIKLGWNQTFLMYGGVISYSIVSCQLYLNVKQIEFDSAHNVTVTQQVSK
ncbi:hypothetical protein PPYR_00770 [Photinus pyralis]|uniref:Gustatory receptor n=1 Tax=Photinus pyralis TaxID=7054 RepID=A0A5N4B324_PHOPY|nr:uncharacterized protein LOC116167277 isoform X2 [Photinus pyralis]KAB0803800.1 hypothetical protein PPYR_00770 [Photinus pyralis]